MQKPIVVISAIYLLTLNPTRVIMRYMKVAVKKPKTFTTNT